MGKTGGGIWINLGEEEGGGEKGERVKREERLKVHDSEERENVWSFRGRKGV